MFITTCAIIAGALVGMLLYATVTTVVSIVPDVEPEGAAAFVGLVVSGIACAVWFVRMVN